MERRSSEGGSRSRPSGVRRSHRLTGWGAAFADARARTGGRSCRGEANLRGGTRTAREGGAGGAATREEVTLPPFAGLPAPGRAKTRLPLHMGGQLCRYLRHLRLRGRRNRPSRSSGTQIGPEFRGNGTGVSAISESEARVFGGFRGQVAICPESPVNTQRGSRCFGPELPAPEGIRSYIYIYKT